MNIGKTNFALCRVGSLYTAANTVIALAASEGSKLPLPSTDGPFPLAWWDDTTYPGNPNADSQREVVWVGSRAGDTLVVSRGAESAYGGGAASTKNTPGSTYKMALFATAKLLQEYEDRLVDQIRVTSAVAGFYAAGSFNIRARVQSGVDAVTITQSQVTFAEPVLLPTTDVNTPDANAGYREGFAKGWIAFKGTVTISTYAAYNVASLSRDGTGLYTVTWQRSFSTDFYPVVATGLTTGADRSTQVTSMSRAGVQIRTDNGAALEDQSLVTVVAYGTH